MLIDRTWRCWPGVKQDPGCFVPAFIPLFPVIFTCDHMLFLNNIWSGRSEAGLTQYFEKSNVDGKDGFKAQSWLLCFVDFDRFVFINY